MSEIYNDWGVLKKISLFFLLHIRQILLVYYVSVSFSVFDYFFIKKAKLSYQWKCELLVGTAKLQTPKHIHLGDYLYPCQ